MIKRISSVILIVLMLLLTACEKEKENVDIINIDAVSKNQGNIEYTIEKVIREDINEELEVDLMMSNRYNREISFDQDVIIKEFFVNKRNLIQKGTLILELDSTKIDRQIDDMRFLLEQEKIFCEGMKEPDYSEKEKKIEEIEVEILEKKLDSLLKKKEAHKVYAQNDCFIIYGDLRNGAKYKKGQAVLRLAESTDYIIKTPRDINLDLYKNVDVGDIVDVKLGINNKHTKARVAYIRRKLNNKGEIYFEDISNTYFFSTGNQPKRVDGEFETVIIKDSLSIKKSAVKYSDKAYVEIMKDGKKRVRYVTTGALGVNEEEVKVVQILNGIKEGDEVIVKEKSKIGEGIFNNLNNE